MNTADTPPFKRPILGVLFDFDGTLTRPGAVDYRQVREELGCPSDRPIIEYLESLPEPERSAAFQLLDRLEYEGALRSSPNPGSREVIALLKARGIPFALLSRNSLRSVRKALESFDFLKESDFSALITRDHPHPPKPDPAAVHWIAREMGVPADQLLTVGDYIYDIEAGRQAGSPTVHLTNRRVGLSYPTDMVIDELSELLPILDLHTPLPMGKLPNRILETVLDELGPVDDKTVIAAGLGEDAAVVRLQEGRSLLVLKSDPITFSTGLLATYLLNVNANDLACTGADPRWFLSTILCPAGTTAWEITGLIRAIGEVCCGMGIRLCGGHTEITDAVTRTVVSGNLAGQVSDDRLIDKRQADSGDIILVTKALAVEGTALLARELGAELQNRGLSREFLERARRLIRIPGISIVPEARIAAGFDGVRALHDVTEGGIATALEELSAASGHRIGVDLGKIPILPETETVCRALEIDPLGLIGSGSLLIAVWKSAAKGLIRRLEDAGIRATRIGELLEPGTGVRRLDRKEPWPRFERDEVARALDSVAD